jgi:hypothetical protein
MEFESENGSETSCTEEDESPRASRNPQEEGIFQWSVAAEEEEEQTRKQQRPF